MRLESLESRRLLSRSPHDVLAIGDTDSLDSQLEYRVRWDTWIQSSRPSQTIHHSLDAEAILRPVLEAGLFPDTPNSRVDSNEGGRFGGVGSLQISESDGGSQLCTASVMGSSHVLTAAHCFDSDGDGVIDSEANAVFVLNDGTSRSSTISVRSIDVHPDFRGFKRSGADDDLAVLTLVHPVPASTPQYAVRGTHLSEGEIIEMVGYGGSGQGNVAGDEVASHPTVKRVGRNQVDLLVSEEGLGTPEVFLYDFDGPTGNGVTGGPTLGNDVETVVLGGDSGSPAFVDGVIVGVNTFDLEAPGSSAKRGQFGVLGGGVVLGLDEVAWIGTIVDDLVVTNSGPNSTGTLRPRVDVSASATTLLEGGSAAQVIFTRTGEVDSTLVVQYEIGGTASPTDFFSGLGVAIIPAGQRQATVDVVARVDGIPEPIETIEFAILANSSYEIGTQSVAFQLLDINLNNDLLPLDNANAPTVTLETGPIQVSEGVGSVRVAVARTGDFNSDLTVHYQLSGDADPHFDFAPLSGVMTVPAGTPFGHITIHIINDRTAEATESLSLSLAPDHSYRIGSRASALLTIQDDDVHSDVSLPVVELISSESVLSEGGGPGQVLVSRTGDVSSVLVVEYSIGGTASLGSDYVPIASTAIIPAGSSSAQIPITVIDDNLNEPTETLILRLAPSPSYSHGSRSSARIEITDNDDVPGNLPGLAEPPSEDPSSQPGESPAPSAQVTVVSNVGAVEEGSNLGFFTFARKGSLFTTLTVNYSVSGTATSSSDFVALAGQAVIPAGVPFVNVGLSTLEDAISENDEVVTVTVSAGEGDQTGTLTVASITIVDNDEGPVVGSRRAPRP